MSLKFAILGLLHHQEMHGYRIKKHIEENFGHMWSVNFGQIYPYLKKLEEEGFVTQRRVPRTGTPDRKIYSITPAGREAFARWLHSDPGGRMLVRDPFLLRFVFFGFGRKARALELIDEQIRLYEAQLERRRTKMRRWQRRDPYVRQMGRLGLLLNETFLEWLRQTRVEIAAEREEEETMEEFAGVGAD